MNMNTIIFGYVRISTMKQSIKRQIDNIKSQYPEAIIIDETYTGTSIDRPQWKKLVDRIKRESKKGNAITLVFDEVSRMSRNAEEGYSTYEELYNMGIELRFIKEPYLNTDTVRQALNNRIEVSVSTGNNATDDFVQGMIDLLNKFAMDMVKQNIIKAFEQAEHEVKYLQKRTKEGMMAADAGEKIRKARQGKTYETKKSKEAKKNIIKMSKEFEGTMKDIEVMKVLGLARNTYYKYKAELKEGGVA